MPNILTTICPGINLCPDSPLIHVHIIMYCNLLNFHPQKCQFVLQDPLYNCVNNFRVINFFDKKKLKQNISDATDVIGQ